MAIELRRPFEVCTVQVHIIDDDEDMREELRELLEETGYAVRLYPDAASFLTAEPAGDGILILDLRLRGMSGLLLQQRLAGQSALQIIFISGSAEVPDSVAAMKAGAHDFLVKPFREQVLIDAVGSAAEKVGAAWSEISARAAVRATLNSLTPAEREVAQLVARGLRNGQIASLTGKSDNTVKVHRARVMQKVGVASACDLAARLRMVGS